MKIGILTYHRSINCGAVMQCYALSKAIQERLPKATVEVVDYHMPIVDDHYRNHIIKNGFLSTIKAGAKWIVEGGGTWQRARKTAFGKVPAYLPLSPNYIYDNSPEELFRYINERYDVIIAGSDAIWNYKVRGFPNPYFLSDRISIPKLSYAASCHGMNYRDIPIHEKEEICRILQSYQFIGVRDDESSHFVLSLAPDIHPIYTCDPTVFLNVDDLPVDESELHRKLEKKGFDFSKKTIGFMGGYNMCSMLRKMYGREYQIVSLYTYCKLADVNLHDITPFEWAYVFRYFVITFTTYYHGLLLSLRNGVPVICVALNDAYSNNYKAKAIDFMERVHLEDWYFKTDYKGKNFSEIKKKSDYLIAHDCSSHIIKVMDMEAASAAPFWNVLMSLV